jgi:Lantibiotic dehydratase, N terminus
MTTEHADDHLVRLPGTGWSLWRDAVLRSAGFPAAGLDRLSDPDCAAVADAFLDGQAGQQELDAGYATALERARRAAARIVADPLFREAVTWQNPAVLGYITFDADQPVTGHKARHKQNAHENTIAQYWQRYCGKNDTIGFFGPVTWVTLDPDAPAVAVRHGQGLVRDRTVYYEYWALEAYARTLATDPVVRPWLPVGLHPHLAVDGHQVLRPGEDPLPLAPDEAQLLARCDGQRPAAEVAGGADPAPLAGLEALAARGLLWWGVDLPQSPAAEQVLRTTLEAIADGTARERALAGLWRLRVAKDAIGAAAGDPDKLAAAIATLDTEFTAVTGAVPERRPGQMYAGRKLCYEESVRDVEVTFGRPVLDALAGPLGRVLLPASRWLSVALADAYSAAFATLFSRLGGSGTAGVPLTEFWAAALPLFDEGTVDGKLPAGEVAAEFTRRWNELFGLDRLAPGTRAVTVGTEEVADVAARLFGAPRPGWAAARIHSPDLQICAESEAALAAGEFTVVLGELHATWPALDCVVFTDRHPEPGRLRAAAAADLGPALLPLYSSWCPHFTPRMATGLREEQQLAFAPEPGADRDRLLPVTQMTVHDEGGRLVAATRDGRCWPLLDVFAILISWVGSELFEPASGQPHDPRITIDRVVVSRETWRTTAGACGLAAQGRLPEYLAARRLRRRLGLPERVFAKVSTETKPVYLDLTSPRYVSAFATIVRSARRGAGDDAQIVLTELLPGPGQAWLADASGNRYFSELRLHARDPMPASIPGRESDEGCA